MEQVCGLKEYIRLQSYRKALGLPKEVEESYKMLAQGEYNRNYVFTHPVSRKKLVLRVNFGSQMHLEDQITYEYQALKLLEDSGRTPRALYVDGSLKHISQGIMVMEYLPGHAMDYEKELFYGAGCLADIHSVKVEGKALLAPKNPLRAIWSERNYIMAGSVQLKLHKFLHMVNNNDDWRSFEKRAERIGFNSNRDGRQCFNEIFLF